MGFFTWYTVIKIILLSRNRVKLLCFPPWITSLGMLMYDSIGPTNFWLVSWDWFSFHTLPQVGVRSVILRLLSSIIWLFVNTQSAGDFNSFCLANTLSIFYGCGVLKINCHTYNSPPEYWKNQYALNQQNKKIPFKIRPYSNFIAGYYIFYGSVRLQIKFIGKNFFQWIH